MFLAVGMVYYWFHLMILLENSWAFELLGWFEWNFFIFQFCPLKSEHPICIGENCLWSQWSPNFCSFPSVVGSENYHGRSWTRKTKFELVKLVYSPEMAFFFSISPFAPGSLRSNSPCVKSGGSPWKIIRSNLLFPRSLWDFWTAG